MEFKQTRQIQVHKDNPDKATVKQIRYIKELASTLGFTVNADILSKNEATREIEQFRKILKAKKDRLRREKEIKLSMVKKLIYKKWIAQNREINRQSETLFMKEIGQLYKIFEKIDEFVFSGIEPYCTNNL